MGSYRNANNGVTIGSFERARRNAGDGELRGLRIAPPEQPPDSGLIVFNQAGFMIDIDGKGADGGIPDYGLSIVYCSKEKAMKMRHESAIRAFSQDYLLIDVYLEDLKLLDANWERDLVSDFLGRRAAVHRPVLQKRETVEHEETNYDCSTSDEDFEDDDCWGASDWGDFLGCDEDDVDDFFDSQLC
jgi:hypothetical protein